MRGASVLWTVLVLIAIAAVPAKADLIGQPVEVDYVYPALGDVYMDLGNGVVSAGGFTVNSFGENKYTVYGSQIVLENVSGGPVSFTPASFNGYGLTETGGAPATITGVTLDAATDVAGVDASDISFDATDVWLNMQGIGTDNGQQVVLDLTFSSGSGGGGSSAVPEPSTYGLTLIGLGCLGLMLMRKRKTQGLAQPA